MALHSSLTGTEIHVACAYTYANATDRQAAIGFVAGDVGKLAHQQDTDTLFLLTAWTPIPNWVPVGTDTEYQLHLGYDEGGYGYIEAVADGAQPLLLQSTDGNVGIGTGTSSLPAYKFVVVETADANMCHIINEHATFSATVMKIGTVKVAGNDFNLLSLATGVTTGTTGGGTSQFQVDGKGCVYMSQGNLCFGIDQLLLGTATKTICIGRGSSPPSAPIADSCMVYCADNAAHLACPTFMTEAGHIIQLYKHANIAEPTNDLTSVWTALKSLLVKLEASGILTPRA